MPYDYATEKPNLFTERGVELLRTTERKTRTLLDASHAALVEAVRRGVSGDDWMILAALDYLAEQGVVVYVDTVEPTAAQHRILVRGPRYAHG